MYASADMNCFWLHILTLCYSSYKYCFCFCIFNEGSMGIYIQVCNIKGLQRCFSSIHIIMLNPFIEMPFTLYTCVSEIGIIPYSLFYRYEWQCFYRSVQSPPITLLCCVTRRFCILVSAIW